MIKTSFLLLSVLFSLNAVAEIPEKAAIDKIFSQWSKGASPGGSVGVIKNGELVFANGYGMANLEYDIPNTAKSIFRIGSTSKQFTAASIILLVEQNKIKLTDTLNLFYPEFPDYAKEISISHLLNHTSGIRDYLTLAALSGKTDDDFYTNEEVMAWLINQEQTNFKPGDEFVYSNSGYWLLGQIVKKVSGMTMAQYAEQEIFKPLKMENTHFHDNHKQIVRNRASGYMPTGENQFEISMTTLDMIGDGGIFTSIEDMKKWDDAYYDTKVLSKSFWKMMTKKGVLNDGEVLDYASGLFLGEYKGLNMISHGGSFVGFRANLIRFPDNQFSVMIFANRSDANPTSKAYEVADLFLNEHYKEEKNQKINKEKQALSFEPESSEMEKVLGHYWNEERADSRRIHVRNNEVIFSLGERREFKLKPVSNNQFVAIGERFDMKVSFYQNDQSQKIMSVEVNGNEPVLSIGYQPISYSNKQLSKFTGEYFSKELNTSYKLKLNGEKLQLYINDKPKSPLNPVMNNLMVNQEFGAFQFSQKPDGSILGFSLAAGRVKNLEFTKL
jgi:CubicO group peptidase (beta-lactamase class C family)